MPEAFIVEAVRSPVGRRGGGLSAVHPNDLGAHVLRALLDRAGLDPAAVDDVIFGCVDQVGAQAANIARNSWLSAGLPETVPGTTLDRQCGSAQQAVHFAAQAVMSGTQDLVIAGGVEVMSSVPISSAAVLGQREGMGFPYGGAGWGQRFGDQEISQFLGAEMIAEKWGITREAMEEFALESHRRALAAADSGWFTDEIAPYADVTADEGPRRDSTQAKLAQLTPLREGGRITAALSSQISDGGSSAPRGLRVRRARPRADASRPSARAERRRLRSGAHVDRTDPGNGRRPSASRTHHGRHRLLRGQRGVRIRRTRLAEGDRCRTRADQRPWRCHRTRASARRHRRATDDYPDPSPSPHWRSVRPPDDV